MENMGGGAAKGDGGVMLFKLCRVASISTVVIIEWKYLNLIQDLNDL